MTEIDADDAANYRNYIKARVMQQLGDKDPIWQALIDIVEARIASDVGAMVGGS